MTSETNQTTQRCTLICDNQQIEVDAREVTIITDEDTRMSRATFGERSVPITEAEADALTVAGAVDGRRHLKTSEQGSII